MIKTYRGLLVDGGQDKIPLHTPDGKTGYRIVKFEILTAELGIASFESIVRLWKVEQTTVATSSATVDFSDNDMLACAVSSGNSGAGYGPYNPATIFEQEIFNQDIYVTHSNNEASAACNYYVELEQIMLTENEALVAIIKDLREEQ